LKSKNIRIITLLAIFSVVGIIAMQTVWFKQAYDLKEKQFRQSVSVALQNVAEQMLINNNLQIPSTSVVEQLSDNYFVVTTNCMIDRYVLEHYLKWEFKKRGINYDFEYGVYDCGTGKIAYGNYISANGNLVEDVTKSELKPWKHDLYYFAVHFPNKQSNMISNMRIWLYLSVVLIIVCIFFSYSLFVILRQKRYSEVQKDFINNITHEFKTPLSTITVSADILKRPEIQGRAQQIINYTAVIKNEAQRLKNHIDKIMQAVSFEKNALKIQKSTFDINNSIKEALNSAQIMIEQKNVKILLNLQENCLVLADAYHITNLLFNIVDNAIKYGPEGQEIEIHGSCNKNNIEIEVRDHGFGISKENLRKVFEKFYRIPTGNVHDVKGFGLGLYYAKMVTESHNGKLQMKSEINLGTTVTLILPKL
jgi:two-component system phosphate regulon sensor histidine kinase PhoR